MKIVKYTQHDFWIAVTVLPVYNLTLGYTLIGDAYFANLTTFGSITLINILIGLPAYQFLHTRAALWFRNRFPAYHQTAKRMLLMLPVHVLLNTHTIFWMFLVQGWLGFHHFPWQRIPWAILLGIVLNTVLVCIHEGVYAFEQWEQKVQETERLKKANLQSQFDSLKQQINPHFLFNSLNSLSSLIEDNPENAQQFVDELSSVYRYLLRSNETELTTLADELAFANSYFHLLRTRYGEHLGLEQHINYQFNNHLLPPLTLQLLLENIVKHNIILPDQPLHIRIETHEDGRLCVQNNLQRRTVHVASNRIGLANIATKYKLLGKDEVQVTEDDLFFTVTLPLLPAVA